MYWKQHLFMQRVVDRLAIQGFLQFGDEKIDVTDTKKENDLIIHFTDKLAGRYLHGL